MTELVFVYGSLRRGFEHHTELEGAEWHQDDALSGSYLVHYEDRYPALVLDLAGQTRVLGEVYWVSGEHLERLDQFEDCPELYQRQHVTLESGDQAWVYVITNERGARYPKIEGPWTGRR